MEPIRICWRQILGLMRATPVVAIDEKSDPFGSFS